MGDDPKDSPRSEVTPWGPYLGQVLHWLVVGSRKLAAALVWPGLALLTVVLLAVILHTQSPLNFCTEMSVRWTGMVLQIVGFGIAAWIVHQSIVTLDGPRPFSALRAYLRRFPRRKTLHFSGTAPGVTASADTALISGYVTVGPGASLEDRVASLETRLEGVHKRMVEIEKTAADNVARVRQEARDAAAGTKAEIAEIRDQLAQIHVTSVSWEWAAILLFIGGVVLASASPELASLLAWCP